MKTVSSTVSFAVSCNGAEIPALGFGTFKLEDRTARTMVREALSLGYRHIDTAQAYGNESAVGAGIADSQVPRDDVFLTTKVWVDRFEPEKLIRSAEQSLSRLGHDYVDLLLLHWPNPDVDLVDTIGALNRVREKGMTRHIGVSNFTVDLIERAFAASDAPLVTNQVEYHPMLNQQKVLGAVRSHGMSLTAYSPLAQGQVFGNDTLEDIASRYGKSAAQVALRWLFQQDDVVCIPRTSTVDHARQNFNILDFELTDSEMTEIFNLSNLRNRQVDPSGLAPDWD